MKRCLPSVAAVTAVALLSLAGCGGGGSVSSETTTAPPAGLVARGRSLYATKGCNACHSLNGRPGVGPTWKGLAGSSVKLSDGTTVTADTTYLTTSIQDPDKQIVASYKPGVMSATIPPGSVSAGDARALVAYIKSLR